MLTDLTVVERRPHPRALIADDDAIVRGAISGQLDGRFSVVAESVDADGAIADAREHHPDVALIDVEMPGGGLHATRGIHAASPETAVVILTADDERSSVLQFLDAGAVAYLRKGISGRVLAARLDEAIAAHRRQLTHTERLLKAAEERFRAAFDQAGVGMAILALEGAHAGRLAAANAAYGQMLGRDPEDLVGANLENWTHPDDLPDGLDDPLTRLARGELERVQYEQRYLHHDGHVLCALVTAAGFTDEDSQRVAIIQVLDISERKRFEGELEYLASHDSLTGLYNRRRFEEELNRELIRAQRYGGRAAVLALDLDGFKFVNDSLGHAAGDELITTLAAAMRRVLRESDVIARTGGDEFSILLPEADEHAARAVAEKLLTAMRREGRMVRAHRHARVTTSIGITLFDGGDDAPAVEGLLAEADVAMYDAKAAGKDTIRVFSPDGRRGSGMAVRENWLRRLREALEEERFVLHAQPIVPVCGNGGPLFELLLRLPDDHGDLIPPGAFLYNAERFGLIQSIDLWVMSQAVRMIHEHHSAGSDLSLSINVSAKTMNEGTIAEHLGGLLNRWPIPEGRLIVELTETAAIANIERAQKLAGQLRSLGCRLALDDFGAGFATFYYLKHLDFDYVKIDGEFIKQLPANPTDQLVVRALVDIANGLGTQTVAEFVQDDETLELLRDFGVGYAQGYHTGRPGALESVLPQLHAPGRATPV